MFCLSSLKKQALSIFVFTRCGLKNVVFLGPKDPLLIFGEILFGEKDFFRGEVSGNGIVKISLLLIIFFDNALKCIQYLYNILGLTQIFVIQYKR